MVSTLSLVFMGVTLAVVFLLPVILAVVFYQRYRISWLAVLVGALVFLIFQVLTRIPLLGILAQMPWYQQMAQNILLIGLFLSFTAGLFEEVGRWLAFRFALKGRWQTKNGVAYGIGHGGFEAIILTGMSFINNLVISLMINSGQFDSAIAPMAGAMAETIRTQLVDTPSYMFLVGGLERVLAITLHIALSLVVLNAVRLGKPVYLLYAILIHTAANLGAVLLSQQPNGILLSEGFLVIVAVLCFLYIRREMQKPDPVEVVEAPAA